MTDDKKTGTPSLITNDARLIQSDGSVITPEDDAVMSRRGPFVQLGADKLQALAEAAKATWEHFVELSKAIMTSERAAFVRELRCQQRYSWRAVAQRCHEEWQGSWEPPSNQLMGMALCEAAAEQLGEDASRRPWN